MSAPATEPITWSPRRLWICVALLFLAQIWAIHRLSKASTTQPPSEGPPFPGAPSVSWALLTAPLGNDEMASNLLATDPTLFALPNHHGFSGPLWAEPGPAEYRPPEWSDPPKFLSLETSTLGPPVPAAPLERRFPSFTAYGAGEPSSEALGLYPPLETPRTNSTLILRGDLGLRGLATLAALPAWPSTEMISNSVVRAAVNAAGTVLSCALTGRSGRPEADSEALRLACRLRFKPLNHDGQAGKAEAGPVVWGDIVISWAMLPSTNPAPALPGP